MTLRTSLRLAITALSSTRFVTPQFVDEPSFHLLTQDDRAIITQDNNYIAIQRELYNLLTEAGFELITQDGTIIGARL